MKETPVSRESLSDVLTSALALLASLVAVGATAIVLRIATGKW